METAKRLNITDSTLHSIKNRKGGREVWAKTEHLLYLSKITGVSIDEIEKNVLAIRKQTGHACALKLPVRCSPSLAGLVGHSFGDGHIGHSPTTFCYTSKNLPVIYHVKDSVQKTFKIPVHYLRHKGNRYDIYFPYIVGELLLKFGSVSGAKTNHDFSVPKWIRDGDKEIKKAFLQALFEDEGSIHNRPDNKEIVFDMWKSENLSYSLKSFLNQLRHLLAEFDITSHMSITGTYVDKKGMEKIGLRISIHGKRNVARFKENINFLSATKKGKLEKLLRSYKRDCLGVGKLESAIHQIVSERPLTSEEISKKLEVSKETAQCAIRRLKKKRLIKQARKSGRFFVWAVN